MKSFTSTIVILVGCLGFSWASVDRALGQVAELSAVAGDELASDTGPGSAVDRAVEKAQNERRLRFNFQGTAWQSVLNWFAEEADLSLQIDQAPQGTVNFIDPDATYSVTEGLDLLNRLLLSRGWALVRDGRMLRIIDLEAENASKLIRETAELITPAEFSMRGQSEIVTCIFPLGGIEPAKAREELAEMVGPWGDIVVLDSARRVKVTETVAKLRAIQEVLEAATRTIAGIVTVDLQHRTADELLEIARPLLGLDPGANGNDDIRISVTIYGDRIFATGMPAKVALLEQVIREADVPLPTPDPDGAGEVAKPDLETHPVTTADIQTVFDVLQTMLAGLPDVRMSIEPRTNSIVASARADTQKLIRDTIGALEGRGTDFEIINLRRLEPSQALLTINKFFGVTETGGEGPTVDGDPVSGKLWVRGTPEQIALVKRLLSEIEGEDVLGSLGDRIRVLPYTGRAAEDALQQMESLWQMTGRENRIRTVMPARGGSVNGGGIPERRLRANPPTLPAAEPQRDDRLEPRGPVGSPDANLSPNTEHRFVVGPQANDEGGEVVESPSDRPRFPSGSSTAESAAEARIADDGEEVIADSIPVAGSDIIIQMTPAGMVIASEDPEALVAFETLMQAIAAPGGAQSDLPTIYWLKYIKADVAAELISSVLGGAESSVGSLADSVIGGLGGGMLGGLLGMGGGGNDSATRSILTSTGSVSIVPDPRLNALIVQGNPIDLEFIDLILEKVDVQESPESVETVARPALIPVIYQDAQEVAELVKAVYAEKMVGQASQSRGGGSAPGGGFSPQDFIAAMREGGGRGGRGGGGGTAAKSEPAKITVAVDARSNSLVVTATPQDFEEIRRLVNALDQQGMESEEGISVVAIPGAVKPDVVKQALESMLGRKVESTSSTNTGSTRTTSGDDRGRMTTGGSTPDDIQRRIEFFRSQFGGGGGGPPGGGFTPRGTGGFTPRGTGGTGGTGGTRGGPPGGGGRF